MHRKVESARKQVIEIISQGIDNKGLTRTQACLLMNIDKARLSRLLSKQAHHFTVDTLIQYATDLGEVFDIEVR